MPGACSQCPTQKNRPVTPHSAVHRAAGPSADALNGARTTSRRRETAAERKARFKTLAEPIYKAVYQSAVRISRDPDLAADLTQDTLLRAFEKFHQFRDGTNFKAWVMRILINGYINRYRKVKRSPEEVTWEDVSMGEERDLSERPDGPALVEDQVIQGISARIVRKAVEELPEPFRTAVILADLQGLSYDEVKGVLGIPLGTVRSRIFRGRKLLISALQPFQEQGAL